MSCPFLREARARSCQAAPLRKLIVEGRTDTSGEKCSSAGHQQCSIFVEQRAISEDPGRCPFLHESLMQYCAAQSVPKMVPYSESQLSKCGSDSYQYCELYLQMAHPNGSHAADEWQVEGIPVPSKLYYTANHMWIDTHESGACHIGIDGFLARLIGRLDGVNFATQRGVSRPSAVLNLHGADWPLVFPNQVLISSANLYLRGNPARLAADPYGSGYLFEGWEPPSGSSSSHGLMHGRQAIHWIRQEVSRLSEFVQQCASRRGSGVDATLCDGGTCVPGLLDHLTRDEMFRLLHEFFDPHAAWPAQ